MVVQKYELVESEKSANARIVQLESSLAHLGDSNEENVQTKGNTSKEKETEMEKQIESLRIENKLLNDTADNSQLLKEQVCKTEYLPQQGQRQSE